MKLIPSLALAFAAVTAPLHAQVVINEVDGQTPGTDEAEFIELYDGGAGGTLLDGLVVVLFNGNGDISYAAYDLDTFSTDGSGFFLLGNVGVPGASITFANNFLQNGADAVAVYTGDAIDFPNGTAATATNLIDAVVYDDGDADDTALIAILTPGQAQVSEAAGGNANDNSVARRPDGGAALNTSTYLASTPTPGTANGPADTLSLVLSVGTISESAGAAALTGTVSRTGSVGDLIVTISVDDDTEASAPATVTILDSQMSAVFDIDAVDDLYPDGTQMVTISVSASDVFGSSALLDVTDDGDLYSLVVNEVYYGVDPTTGDANGDAAINNADEFIEIVNVTASAIDLSGYEVFDGFGDIHQFRAGTMLSPGCAVVIFGGPGVTEGSTAAFGEVDVQISTNGGLFLNDDGDTVTIRNAGGIEVFRMDLPDVTGTTADGSLNLSTEVVPGGGYGRHATIAADPLNQFSPGTLIDGTPHCGPLPTITVVLSPDPIAENAGASSVTATVTLSAPVPTGLPGGGLVCKVVSSDPSELVLNPGLGGFFFFAEGETVVAGLPFDAVDDLDADGPQSVTITMIASGYLNGSDGITVNDDGDVGLSGDLFISEYAEGSSNNKYLEIYNPTSVTLDLDDYRLGIVYNAPANIGQPDVVLTFAAGTMLAPGDTWVIANPSASAFIPADETNGSITFNGDDGIGLLKGTTSTFVIIDHVGNFDGDPGSSWDVAGVGGATANHTLVRKNSVIEGNTDWDLSRGTNTTDSEWIVLPQDDWSSAGIHPNLAAAPDLVITDISLLSPTTVGMTFTGNASTSYVLKSDPNLQGGFTTVVSPTGGSLTTDGAGDGTVEFAFIAGELYFRLEE